MTTRKRTKITEITVEQSEVLVVRKSTKLVFAWCGRCADEVRMCPPEEAATVARVSTRTIYRWVEAGKVHFTETAEGPLLVCLNSMF